MSMLETQSKMTPYDGRSFDTMIPGPFIKFMRTCKIWQFIRFIAINIKMLTVVSKSH